MTVGTVLLILAFVCAVLATLGIVLPHVNFGWLAIALWTLSILVGGAHALTGTG